MEPEDEEGLGPFEEVPTVKKRRKNPKKVVQDKFLLLPAQSTDGLSDDVIEELQEAYK